jgi:hypothetical protein
LHDGRLLYRLKQRWRDGTTHLVLEPLELLEKLAALVPPPRFHLVRYHGILGPCASARDRVVPARGVAATEDRPAAWPAHTPLPPAARDRSTACATHSANRRNEASSSARPQAGCREPVPAPAARAEEPGAS